MAGGEYLSAQGLDALWEQLDQWSQQQITEHGGLGRNLPLVSIFGTIAPGRAARPRRTAVRRARILLCRARPAA